ncbi:MAG: response regulator [Cyanobacteria bacterium]|nr:response regulator [Cyanobacteriota bacterium]
MTWEVMHVDSDEATARLLESILSDRGYNITSIASGHEAIEILKKEERDLIIVGDVLSDLDGIGWIVQLRKVRPKTKVVFITKSWTSSELYETLTKQLKVELVVVRPIKPQIFGPQINAIMSGETKTVLSPEELHEHAFNSLKQKYVATLTIKLDTLKQTLDKSRNAPDNEAHLLEAIRLAHNLKGTSGSCGFIDLSESSAQLEHALKAIHESQLTRNSVAWDEIDQFFHYVELTGMELLKTPSSPDAGDDENMRYGNLLSTSLLSLATMANANRENDSKSTESNDSSIDSNGDNGDKHIIPAILDPESSHEHVMDVEHPSESPYDPSSIRVLVMSSENPMELKRELDGLPVRLIGAKDPIEAMTTARWLALDAALIDIDANTPEPGITLARNIRSLPGNENLPVAFVSTLAEPGNPIESNYAGASLHLKKPVRSQMLSNAVDYLLSVRTGGRPRVLIVDDDEDFVRVVAALLGNEGTIVKGLTDPTYVIDVIGKFSPDVVLLDVMMPGTSGYQICRKIREHKQWQDLPVLFLTGQTGLSARLAAFEAGGDDYLPKPVAPAELSMRVRVRLERARMLRERADKDVLTGLMIRRAFMEQMDALISESKNNNLKFSLSLLDVDHFKHVNDTYGHLAGDRVLAALGQLLRRRFRVEDLRGRWGGEEFIVAFRHIGKETAKGALERCLEELRGHVFEGDNGEQFQVSFSSGLVCFPEDGISPQVLIKCADECLYEAKRRGRNQVVERVSETN